MRIPPYRQDWPEGDEVRARAKEAGLPDPYHRFLQQRRQAEKRGVGWNMTFKEWWGLWEPHFHERGSRKMQKVMCRHLDRGDYEVGNVRIDYACSNAHERKMSRFAKYGGKNRKHSGVPSYLASWHEQQEIEEEYE